MRKWFCCLLLSVISVVCLVGAGAVGCPVGDLDGNCRVGLGDIREFAEQWLAEGVCSNPDCANLDGVGAVTMKDFAELAKRWREDHSGLLITEFMAVNNEAYPDELGEYPDWIEIYNPMDVSVDLQGWYLTDDADEDPNLTKWRFPAGVVIKPGEFRVVFASGDDRRNPDNPLHADFKLGDENEEVALVTPDGETIAYSYAAYPHQIGDVSYGLMQYSKTLIESGATVSYHVPTAADAGLDFTPVDFPDSSWERGATGLNFGFGGTERYSYNDCVYEEDQYLGNNVTTYGIGDGFGGSSSGPLVDQATGDPTGVTVTLDENGGVNWQPSGTGGTDCAPGTDAYNTFGGLADMTGVIYYGSSGWWVDIAFTGLEPGTDYTFATSAARNNYPDRWTRYSIIGADTYTNASTAGVTEIPGSGGSAVRFNTGDNHDEGYVARWTGIRASDGAFKVRAQADPENPNSDPRKAYSFDVFMLKGGFSGTNVSSQMEGINASIWARAEFHLEAGEREIFEKLTLRMKYDDGFVAYLNGVKVASSNNPRTLAWNSSAMANRPIEEAGEFETFNLTQYVGLLRDGKNVLAIHALNDDKDDGEFLVLPELVAASGAGVPQYFSNPTPGEFNVEGAQGLVSEVWFSHDRGFYESPFDLTLSTAMSSAEIRYTLDGSRPTISHGTVYSGPIRINGTSTVRAAAVKAGYLDSEVETSTYIFVSDVVHQSPNGELPGPGWPTDGTRGQKFEYGMDPAIVNHGTWGPLLDDALLAIPTMSVVTDLDNLFYNSSSSSTGGIYVSARGDGRAWERPTSL
ncbi:MAG: chitobiase/beta-hexosaminidase C-terminal domain-containing protein, partial [Planctomycetota bacterium]